MGQGEPTPLRPAPFFVLRTPLLPFDDLEAWAEGGDAETKRSDLVAGLRGVCGRPVVREAIYLASPLLAGVLDSWLAGGRVDEPRLARTLVSYLVRMTTRATPFGLFAGCSVGAVGDVTRLDLAPRSGYERHSRLDMEYLSALVVGLERLPGIRDQLLFEPNSSLYDAAGRLHYAEARQDVGARTYGLVEVQQSEELSMALERARTGARPDEVAAALEGDGVTRDEAAGFVNELIDSQVLVSGLAPEVTGAEPAEGLIARLGRLPDGVAAARRLEAARERLERLDAAGLGLAPEVYRRLEDDLAGLPATVDPAHLVQVDMFKPGVGLSLGPAVVAEVRRGLEILRTMARPSPAQDFLERFRERFAERYETAEVPLLEALDAEVGVNMAGPEPGQEPLLRDLRLPPGDPAPRAPQPRDRVLLRKLAVALDRRDHELALTAADLAELAAPDPPPLPDTLEVVARLIAPSAEAADRGRFRLVLETVFGPPGVRLLGRFCHASTELRSRVEEHLRAEEARRPDALFAEVVHMPEGRHGNILVRPVLREHEITYLGRSGAPGHRQIPASDLLVSVRGDRVALRSARLGREVIPRLTMAHYTANSGLMVYRFLDALQDQGTPRLSWSWGELANGAPFLPRVTCGRLVLWRAEWNLDAGDLPALLPTATGPAAVQAWRSSRRMPRHVALVEGDNELMIDLDNPLCVDVLAHELRTSGAARVVEQLPAPDELCVSGPEGRFLHELVIPFVREPGQQPAAAAGPAGAPSAGAGRRRHAPGSDWLYAKLYVGTGLSDRVLTEVVRPLVAEAVRGGAVDRWFFIRYADPEPHLRLRLHGAPARLWGEVLPVLHSAGCEMLADGRAWRVQLDTYMPEVERYGGWDGLLVAERLFFDDSEAALTILAGTRGDQGRELRWKLAFCAVDQLLEGLGMAVEERLAWAQRMREAFEREHRADSRLRRQIGERHRAERALLERLLAAVRGGAPADPLLEAVRTIGRAAARAAAELHELRRTGRLQAEIPDLAASYAHMHLNRIHRDQQRPQELVIYSFLERTYRSWLARGAGR